MITVWADKKKKKDNKLMASMALDMAIILPLILSLILLFYANVQEIEYSISARHALDQLAKEIEVLYPLSDLISNKNPGAEHKLIDLLRDLGVDDQSNSFINDFIFDVTAGLLAGSFVNQRYDHWLKQVSDAKGYKIPGGSRRIFVDYKPEIKLLYLGLSYEKTGFLTGGSEIIISQIPLWSENMTINNSVISDIENVGDEIWSLSNFERGLMFREIYGANLSVSYPTIAIWKNETATAIKSMDLTAPSWMDKGNAEKRIFSFLTDLAEFNGTTSGEGPAFGEIRYRELILIIPNNHPSWLNSDLEKYWRSYADSMGVKITISRYAESKRYSD